MRTEDSKYDVLGYRLCCGIPRQGRAGKLGGEGRASGRAEWSLEVNGWFGELGGRGQGRAGAMTVLTGARDSSFSSSPPHRCPDVWRALWLEAGTRHICGHGPSEDPIHRVKQGRTERHPRIPHTSQIRAQCRVWEKPCIHSFIDSFSLFFFF